MIAYDELFGRDKPQFGHITDLPIRSGTITIDINNCTRCGQNHANVRMKQFVKPIASGEMSFTHWAWCPVSKGPILVQITHKQS